MPATRKAKLRKIRNKAVGSAPNYLKTVMIAKPQRKPRVAGSFGAASAVIRIDPKTGLPREESV